MTPRQENVITENTPGTSTECSPIKKKEALYWVRILRFYTYNTIDIYDIQYIHGKSATFVPLFFIIFLVSNEIM